MNLNNALWYASIGAHLAIAGLLIYRREWRRFPVFCLYCLWGLCSDAVHLAVLFVCPSIHLAAYLGDVIVGSVLEFGVLFELSWSVLRPLRELVPRRTLLLLAGFFLVLGTLVWQFTGLPGLPAQPSELRQLVHLQQTASAMRLVFFLLLAGSSQWLALNWRNRELQIVTGLGFCSIASLGSELLRSHLGVEAQFGLPDQLIGVSYFLSLLYWIFCLLQKEAARRAFSPRMQRLLLAAAGVAQAERLAFAGDSKPKPTPDKR